MKKILFLLVILIMSCNSSKSKNSNATENLSEYETLLVTNITNGKDGYTATLKNDAGNKYICTISIPNLGSNYIDLKVGDKVKIEGEYLESDPVQIVAKRVVKIE